MSMIAVWGPPQSGKTTLSIDLAYAISQQGKSVCLISPEPYSELTARMGIRIVKDKSLEKAFENIGNLKQSVLEVDDLLFVLAEPWDHDAYGEEAGTESVKELLKQSHLKGSAYRFRVSYGGHAGVPFLLSELRCQYRRCRRNRLRQIHADELPSQ